MLAFAFLDGTFNTADAFYGASQSGLLDPSGGVLVNVYRDGRFSLWRLANSALDRARPRDHLGRPNSDRFLTSRPGNIRSTCSPPLWAMQD